MKIKAERIFGARRLIQRLDSVLDELRLPLRKRWVIGNKIIPDFRACSGRISRHYAFYEGLVPIPKFGIPARFWILILAVYT